MKKLDENRGELEEHHPILIACNLTLDQHQLNGLQGLNVEDSSLSWNEQTAKKWIVLLASDGKDEAGDFAMRESPQIHDLIRLRDLELPGCFADKEYMYVMADMIAMSLMDLHMDNPLSMCGEVVAHWRSAMGKERGSSWPRECYDRRYV